MTKRFLPLILLACARISSGAYQYYDSEWLTAQNTTNWWNNGSPSYSLLSGLSSSTAASLISRISVPDGTSYYEVAMTLKLPSSGGTYIAYLRASQDAQATASSSTGTYYAVEVVNPYVKLVVRFVPCWVTLLRNVQFEPYEPPPVKGDVNVRL